MRTEIDKIDEAAFIEKFWNDMEKDFGAEHVVVIANKGDNVAFHYKKKSKTKLIRILEISLSNLKNNRTMLR